MSLIYSKAQTPIEEITALLRDHGHVIIDQLLTRDQVQQLNHDLSAHFLNRRPCPTQFFGRNTVRIDALLDKSPLVSDLVLTDAVIKPVEQLLIPHCDHIQLNLTQGIAIHPGQTAQRLHPDAAMYPINPLPFELMINAMWALTDFTQTNGATRIVPGSHGPLKPGKTCQYHTVDSIPVTMKAGSVLLYVGSLWHGGGENISLDSRIGLVVSYCLGWLRQSENQYLAYSNQTVRGFDERIQNLLGYQVHRPNLGWVAGQDPKYLLNPATRGTWGARDFLRAH